MKINNYDYPKNEMNIKISNYTYEDFLSGILENKPFSFSRYGDGEWNSIFGKVGHNCDGHEYFPDMGQRLIDIVISKPKYVMGLQNLAVRIMGDKIKEFLRQYNVELSWVYSDILHRANIKKKMDLFFEALRGKTIILVGPSHLKPIKEIDPNYMVEISGKNCWEGYLQTKESIEREIKASRKSGVVVLLCASMMSNVLVDDLYNMYEDEHYFLDIGSVLEPHVGISIRSYHKGLVK